MLQASVLGLGVGTLCAVLAAIGGAEPIEIPEPTPPTRYLALGGELVELAAEAGPGCFAPMLDELRRHPRWSIRIDDLEWGDVVDGEPDPRLASIVLDAAGGTWRDGWLPQSLSLAEDERRAVLAAFALDCRVDPAQPEPGYVGRYIGVALGEDGAAVTRFRTNSFVALRLGELFGQIRARYFASRAADLNGFALELAGPRRTGRDDRGRSIYEPYHLDLRDPGPATHDNLEDRVQLLDWAMTLPVALPAGNQVVRGTLRAYGTSRPIAIDLRAVQALRMRYSSFSELGYWASMNHESPVD
jgi:hypothetical protein